MIDVSSLTDFQAKIALLIERSGNIGRRVSEFCNESGATKAGICKALKHLTITGLIVKIVGDVPRYYSAPSVNVGSSVLLEKSAESNLDSNLIGSGRVADPTP